MEFNKIKLALAVSVALILAACSPTKTSDEYVARAKIYISNNQNSDALIDLKNAIKLSPKAVEPRLVLGNLYLSLGQGADAEKELSRAYELSSDISLVTPGLFRAYSLQENNEEIIELAKDSSNLSTSDQNILATYTAIAYFNTDNQDEAEKYLAIAEKLAPNSKYTLLGKLHAALSVGDIDEAKIKAKALLVEDEKFIEGVLIAAQTFYVAGDLDSAINLFEEYKSLQPNDLRLSFYLATSYLANKNYVEAEKEISLILQKFPRQPVANQIMGTIQYTLENYEKAEANLLIATQNGLDTTGNRWLIGSAAFQQKKYETAYVQLVSIVDEMPLNHRGHRVLAITQLALGYSEDAGVTLSKLPEVDAEDAELLALSSFELLKLGKFDKARELLDKSKEFNAEDSLTITRQGMLGVMLNDPKGLEDLKKANEQSPDLEQSNLALISALIASNKLEEALVIATKWNKNESDNINSYNALALTYQKLAQNDKALAVLEEALKIDNMNTQSYLFKADYLHRTNNPQEALTVLEQLLSLNPDSISALIKHYQVAKQLNKESSSIELIKSNFNRNSNAINRVLYAQVMSEQGENQLVVDLLDKFASVATSKMPLNYWVLLGQSYEKLKDVINAERIYKLWSSVKPDEDSAWLNLAKAQEKRGNVIGALSTLQKGIGINSYSIRLKVMRVHLFILDKRIPSAEKELFALPKSVQEQAIVQSLYGRILIAQGDYAKAAPKLLKYYAIKPEPKVSVYIAAAYLSDSQVDKAIEFMGNHLKSYPLDISSRTAFADISMKLAPDFSIIHYHFIIDENPKNVIALNNLAWLYTKQNELEKAEALAKKAVSFLPKNPHILDTLGMIKYKQGFNEEALALVLKAHDYAPNNANIKRHLDLIKSNL